MRPVHPLVALLGFAAASAVGANPPVILQDTETPALGSPLTLTFDQPMLTWKDGTGHVPDIQIEPAFPCLWEWKNDIQIGCRAAPEAPGLKNASTYRITVKGLRSRTGEAMAPASRIVETERPWIYVDVSWQHGWPVFMVNTNQKTTSASLQSHLRLEDVNGHALKAHWELDHEYSRDWVWPSPPGVWQVSPVDRRGRDVVVNVRALPGMKGLDGPLPGSQETFVQTMAAEPFAIRRLVCTWKELRGLWWETSVLHGPIVCTPGGTVSVVFTAQLSKGALERLEQSAPDGLAWQTSALAGPARDTREDPYRRADASVIVYEIGPQLRQIQLKLPADIADADGHPLGHRATLAISAGDMRRFLKTHPAKLVPPMPR
jgi:hypothetical protein